MVAEAAVEASVEAVEAHAQVSDLYNKDLQIVF